MRLNLLAVVAVGVCLLPVAAEVQGADKEEDSYAKVELKGSLRKVWVPLRPEALKIVIEPGECEFELDLSQVPEGKDLGKLLKRLEEKTVIVKGALGLTPRTVGKHRVMVPIIIVKSICDADLM